MAINLSGLPTVPMRILTMVLFIMASWATVGSGWLGLSYILSNYVVVLLGLWAERDTPAPVPVQFFFFGMVFTLLNDVLSIGITYNRSAGVTISTFRFNAAMAIILILIKPIACLFIYKEWTERVGGGGEAQSDSNYERLGGQTSSSGGGFPQGGNYGGYAAKSDPPPPQYQPPHGQPFP